MRHCHSKYDVYWDEKKLAYVKVLIEEAVRNGKSSEMDITDIKGYGNRMKNNWVRTIVARCGPNKGIVKGMGDHLKSLVENVIINTTSILDSYPGIKLKFLTKTYGNEDNFKICLQVERVA